MQLKIKFILLCALVIAFVAPQALAVSPRGPAAEGSAAAKPALPPAPAPRVLGEQAPEPAEPSDNGKLILVDLATQTLSYFDSTTLVGSFKISSGTHNSTPTGEYSIVKKLPAVHYKGANYDYPNTKWNLLFKPGKPGYNLYIHGAYWHNNFGHPMSHGCVNVSYANMEVLYNWADVGTRVVIQ